MRSSTLRLLPPATIPLILTAAAPGGFVGITTSVKPNPFGIKTVNVYAVFDRPGQDRFLAAAGTLNTPMNINVDGGTFYQNPFGSPAGLPPSNNLIPIFPSLAFDSFVTIGAKSLGPPNGQNPPGLILTPGFAFGAGPLAGTNLGWANTVADPNTDPFNPAFVNGDGSVLIGQFSTLSGTNIYGSFKIAVISNNVLVQIPVSFYSAFECTDGNTECDGDGDPCNGVPTSCLNGICEGPALPPSPDCNRNGFLDSCDIAGGNSADLNKDGVPDECQSCNSDLDGDGSVGITDFLMLLSDWGQCP